MGAGMIVWPWIKNRSVLPLGLSPLHSQQLPRCSQAKADTRQTQPPCRKMPFLAVSLYLAFPLPTPQLTVNEDVDPLELFQCLIHRCHNGLGLPDIYGQRQTLLACGCHQLFRGL